MMARKAKHRCTYPLTPPRRILCQRAACLALPCPVVPYPIRTQATAHEPWRHSAPGLVVHRLVFDAQAIVDRTGGLLSGHRAGHQHHQVQNLADGSL